LAGVVGQAGTTDFTSSRIDLGLAQCDADAVAADQAGADVRRAHEATAVLRRLAGAGRSVAQYAALLRPAVLDDLGGFGEADTAGRVGAGGSRQALGCVSRSADSWFARAAICLMLKSGRLCWRQVV
jgi:hypothetical protein